MKFNLVQDIIDVIRGKKKLSSFFKKPLYLPQNKKEKIIKKYFKNFDCKIFVETGTYLGDTTFAMKDIAEKIYTIELSDELYKNAVLRFQDYKNITCLHGDSAVVLIEVLKQINEKTLFWLDGHYSSGITARGVKDTPILEELEIIYNAKKLNHILLIDDARCFDGKSDYPSIEELKKYILSKWPDAHIESAKDIIRVITN